MVNIPHHLSRLSWRVWSIGSDNGRIAKTGVARETLSPQWAARFLAELNEAPADTIRPDDHLPGYFNEPRPAEMAYLNGLNEYRAVTPSLLAALGEFLDENRARLDDYLGHS